MLPPTLEGAMSTGHHCMLQIWSCVWNIGGSFCVDAVGQGLGVAVVWWDTRERERERDSSVCREQVERGHWKHTAWL